MYGARKKSRYSWRNDLESAYDVLLSVGRKERILKGDRELLLSLQNKYLECDSLQRTW